MKLIILKVLSDENGMLRTDLIETVLLLQTAAFGFLTIALMIKQKTIKAIIELITINSFKRRVSKIERKNRKKKR